MLLEWEKGALIYNPQGHKKGFLMLGSIATYFASSQLLVETKKNQLSFYVLNMILVPFHIFSLAQYGCAMPKNVKMLSICSKDQASYHFHEMYK